MLKPGGFLKKVFSPKSMAAPFKAVHRAGSAVGRAVTGAPNKQKPVSNLAPKTATGRSTFMKRRTE